jgi:hypothetical protein
MEAFEQFCAVAMQTEGLVVSSGVKFPVQRRTRKERAEYQTHGYEVDLIGARADRLVLATVKSYFGSRGVQAREVTGQGGNTGLYRLLNNAEVRDGVVAQAAERYGYRLDQITLRLYVGQFARHDELEIRAWCAKQHVGAGPIDVIGLSEVVPLVYSVAKRKTYINDAVVVSMKVLAAAGVLMLDAPIVAPTHVDLEDQPDDPEA